MQEIFSKNSDIEKSAFINWRFAKNDDIRNILVLADGYMQSAIQLAKGCLNDNQDKKADILIFPILSNVNHGIELYLKGMIWTINKLMKLDGKIEGRHNIKQIYDTLKSKIEKYQGQITLKSFNKDSRNLKEYIDELTKRIKSTPSNDKMDFSRYPFSGDYDNHFYIDEIGNIEVDIENFVIRFTDIHESLENLSSYLFYQELNEDW